MATTQTQINSQVDRFLATPRRMMIGNKWVEAQTGKTFPVYNPATGEVMAQVAEGAAEDIDRAVKAARKAFQSGMWRTMTASERGKLLWKLADLIDQNLEEFSLLESLDKGSRLLSREPPMSLWRPNCSATWRAGRRK